MPNGQSGQPIDTIDPGFRGSFKTRLGLGNPNDSAADRRSARILNRSGDLGTSIRLCPKTGVCQQGECNTCFNSHRETPHQMNSSLTSVLPMKLVPDIGST